MRSWVLVLAALMLSAPSLASEITPRERLNFDAGWRFHRGPLPGNEVDNGLILHGWKCRVVGKDKPDVESLAAFEAAWKEGGFKPAKNHEDVFDRKPGYAWFVLDLPEFAGPRRILHFVAVDDNATVWVNGKKLIHHEGWNDPFSVPLDSAWKEGGPNRVVVLVQNIYAPGYIKEAVLLSPDRPEKVPAVAGVAFSDKGWREVRLPHDFVVEGAFDPKGDGSHGFLPKDMAWYRKTFEVPASDKGRVLWLDFDGVYRDSRVWLNGKLLGRHPSGYTSFRYDITKAVNYGDRNILTVHVDARGAEGWWYEGGGIYRHVWLNKADPLHVKPWGVQVISKPVGAGASLSVETTLSNRSNSPASGRLVTEIRDPQGRTVLTLDTPFTLKPGAEKSLTQKGTLAKAVLWDLKAPNLYRAVTRIERKGGTADSTETSFGIRTVRFDKDRGFFLNGKPVKLKGTCNHQDHAGVGVAVPDRLFAFRIEKLLEMGSNAYRCAHNPPAPELLDACDRLGMLVVDENRRLGDTEDILGQVESMVLRDRNHPSIILWSLCNEESLQDKAEGRRRAEAMKKVLFKHDRTRLVTAAMNYGWGGDGLSNALDVQGFNYNQRVYDSYRADHPTVPLYGSETASTVSTRGEYVTDRVKGTVSAYDVNHTNWSSTAAYAWRSIAERDWMAGAFVWTGFDYRGEPTPYSWPCINSHFGILDMCGFPKDNFWYYKAWWGDKPVLHLFPHWNWPEKMEQQVEVWCHTNYPEVELLVNDESMGFQDVPKNGAASWRVWYKPGKITVKAWVKNKVVAETSVETTGKPAQIRLEPYQDGMIANAGDVMPVAVSILDDQDRLVQTAENKVTFKVEGPGSVAGVGNGDPSSHEPDKASARKAFHGLCQVLVGAGEKPGTIRLIAESPGLKSAAVTMESKTP